MHATRRPDADPAGAAPSSQALVAAIWIAVGCANLVLLALGPSNPAEVAKVLGTTLCGLVLSSLLAAACRRLIARGQRRAWAVLALVALVGGACLWAFDATLQDQDFSLRALHWPSRSFLTRVRLNLVYYELLFFLQASVLALLALQRTVRARERQLVEARLAAQQARLAALRFQLNPHFLFNTLNAISTLVGDGRAGEAEEMIARLSGFLRTSLEPDEGDLGRLEVELDRVRAYLEIEAVRFGDRLDVRYACEEGLSDALVPKLILQPLVENAVKHAVAIAKAPVTVSISARRCGVALVLAVEDDGGRQTRDPRAMREGTGVGLRNVAARLDAFYGAQARFDAGSTDAGFLAVAHLPLARAHDEAPA